MGPTYGSARRRDRALAQRVLGGSVAIAFAAIVTLDAAHAGPAGAKSTKGNAAVADAQGVKKQKPLPEVTPEGPLDAQFCQAVRDAATEARFAYQSEKLEGLAKEIDERLAKLNAKTAELKEWMAKRDDFKSRSSAQLVSIFAAMRPESASEQLTKIDPATAASILSKLEARAASAILNDMPSDKAAALASILAGSAQQDAPSRQ